MAATRAATTFISATAHSSDSGGGGIYGINFPGSGNDDSSIDLLGIGMLIIQTLANELLFFDHSVVVLIYSCNRQSCSSGIYAVKHLYRFAKRLIECAVELLYCVDAK